MNNQFDPHYNDILISNTQKFSKPPYTIDTSGGVVSAQATQDARPVNLNPAFAEQTNRRTRPTAQPQSQPQPQQQNKLQSHVVLHPPQSAAEQPVPKNNSNKLYKYFNGEETVYEDPFEIQWRMQHAVSKVPNIDEVDKWADVPRDENGNIIESLSRSEASLFNDAVHIYIPLIIESFQLKPLDKKTGEGLTSEQIIDIYTNYIEWKSTLKKNID